MNENDIFKTIINKLKNHTVISEYKNSLRQLNKVFNIFNQNFYSTLYANLYPQKNQNLDSATARF